MTDVTTDNEIIETVQAETQTDDNEVGKWYVYMHTSPSGKRYIGITKQPKPEYRWKSDGKGYLGTNPNGTYKQPRMACAVKKYSWDSWKHEILFSNQTENKAKELEKTLIKYYKTRDPNYGYNYTEGGSGTTGLRRFGADNPNYGNHKLSGKNNPMWNKTHSEETKQKIRELKAGFKNSGCRPVYCIELNEIFWGAKAAEIKYKIDNGSICKCCRGRIKTIGKHPESKIPLRWRYVDDFIAADGTAILGAISLGYITQEDLDNYINNLKQKGNDIYESKKSNNSKKEN